MSVEIQPDNQAAIEFLIWAQPNGPWCVSAINLDQTEIKTATFEGDQVPQLRAWLDEFNGKWNIYWQVNQVSRPMSKKPKRSDIRRMLFLHVDIDPRAGEDLDAEQARALESLRNPPPDVPAPSVILFSGGGYQGFWRLEDPIEINGELAKAEDAKLYNIFLEQAFGADNCHNIDRIMRLPGTVNLPTAKKQAKGRRPELARVVEKNDRTYRTKDLSKARVVQTGDDTGFGGKTVEVSGNLPRLKNIDDLDNHTQEKVPDRIKAVIVTGEDPLDTTRYASRSEALFAVCCALVRAGANDDVVYTVITDPDFGISSSVLDKGASSETYALRQIERAREETINPVLRELNERHAVISVVGDKCRILSEVYEPTLDRPTLSLVDAANFRLRYCNRKVQVGEKDGRPVFKEAGDWWIHHPMRRQYDAMVFAPGKELPPKYYNLWKGFAVEAREGDCSLYLDHILKVICSGNEEYYTYLIKWLARAVQSPSLPGETAVVMRGSEGIGKGVFAKCFGRLWGRHFIQITDPKHLLGSFNAHQQDCVVLFGDEAFYAGDKSHESVLKGMITEDTRMTEKKNIDAETGRNYIHLILASNSNWLVPAGANARRYFVLDVSDERRRDHAYFSAILDQMENGGYEALLYYLLHYDLTGFRVSVDMPMTEALREQKELSYSPEEEWWYSKLRDGRVCANHDDWQRTVPKLVLQEDYVTYAQARGVNRRATDTALGRFLQRVMPSGWPKTKQVYSGSKRPYIYEFPSLDVCRKAWDDRYGGPFDWPVIPLEQDVTDDGEPF